MTGKKGLIPLFLAGVLLFTGACTDPIKFGDSFLEKPAGGDTNEDTVFNSSVYTTQFLNNIYRQQYYGLTFGTGNANCNNGWTGKFEALTDCWELYYAAALPWKQYYTGSRDANSDGLFGFSSEKVWEAVRASYKRQCTRLHRCRARLYQGTGKMPHCNSLF